MVAVLCFAHTAVSDRAVCCWWTAVGSAVVALVTRAVVSVIPLIPVVAFIGIVSIIASPKIIGFVVFEAIEFPVLP